MISQEKFVPNRHHYLHVPLPRNQNSAQNFVFAAEFSQNSDITAEFYFIIYTYPCLEIKILLRILFLQQNFVRILIFYENFVSNRHHYLHLPLSRNQNSAQNFVFAAEFCQNSDILREFCLKQTSLSTSTLVSKSKFCLKCCFRRRILSKFRYHSRILFPYLHLPLSRNRNSAQNFGFAAEFCRNSDIIAQFSFIIYTYPCVEIKILLRILFSQQNFLRTLISQQTFV